MRQVLVIAWFSLRRTARDRQALIVLLFMPMLLIAILGTALGPMMTASRIEPFPVLVVNQDTPVRPPLPPGAPAAAQVPSVDLGRVLVDEVLAADAVARILTVSVTGDLDAARAEVAAGRAAAVIHVPAGFTADVFAGRATQLHVWTDAGRPTRSGIVEQVARSFTEGAAARVAAARLAAVQGGAVAAPAEPVVAELPAGTRRVSAMQYYAAAMAVMFMLMTALTRARECRGSWTRCPARPPLRWWPPWRRTRPCGCARRRRMRCPASWPTTRRRQP